MKTRSTSQGDGTWKTTRILLILCVTVFWAITAVAEMQVLKGRMFGLFQPDREADLRQLVDTLPDLELVSVNYASAEVAFRFDPAKLFPKTRPEEVLKRLDDLIRNRSRGTFGINPPSTTPREKLTLIEISIAGLDCKACSFAAYEAVARIDGVEQATASFKEGKLTALIDPTKTDRDTIEAALKRKDIAVVQNRDILVAPRQAAVE